MAIRLQTFFRTARTRYGLRLLAGRSGLAHEFSWVHLLEDIGNADFLRGGELVITTGLAALQEHWLRDFVHALARRQAAALILNTGKYLREGDITDEVRALCDAAALPHAVAHAYLRPHAGRLRPAHGAGAEGTAHGAAAHRAAR